MSESRVEVSRRRRNTVVMGGITAARTPAAIIVLLVAGLAGWAQPGSLRHPLTSMSVAGASGKGIHAGVLQLPLDKPGLPFDTLSPLALPPDLVRAEQWPSVEATLQAAVARLSRASGSHIHRVEALRDWLLAQGCVEQVSAPIRGAGGVNAVLMLTADPALVPIQITFRTEEQRPATTRLLLAVNRNDGLSYVSLRRAAW